MSAIDRARKLAARAAHPSTPVEEARTSATILAKMIGNEVVLVDAAEYALLQQEHRAYRALVERWVETGAADVAPTRAGAIPAQFASKCAACGGRVDVGDPITRRARVWVHAACASTRAT